jgi:hypothetical protein
MGSAPDDFSRKTIQNVKKPIGIKTYIPKSSMDGLMTDNGQHGETRVPRSIITHSTIVLGTDKNSAARSLSKGSTSKTY